MQTSVQVGDLISVFHIIGENRQSNIDTGVVVGINDDLCPALMFYYSFEHEEVIEEYLEDYFQVEILKKGAKA